MEGREIGRGEGGGEEEVDIIHFLASQFKFFFSILSTSSRLVRLLYRYSYFFKFHNAFAIYIAIQLITSV